MKNSGGYYVIVVEDLELNKVIGASTLVVEQKFIHNCALVRIKLYFFLLKMSFKIDYYLILKNR